jgi:hypothetical protein
MTGSRTNPDRPQRIRLPDVGTLVLCRMRVDYTFTHMTSQFSLRVFALQAYAIIAPDFNS